MQRVWIRRITIYLAGVLLGTGLLVLVWQGDEQPSFRRALVEGVENAHYPYTFTDGLGRQQRVEARPETLVSLAPSATEIVFALNAGDRLAANTQYGVHPPEAKALPKVGRMDAPNLERMLELQPDWVLASTLTPRDVIERIESVGLKVAAFKHEDIPGLLEEIRVMGRLIGKPVAGEVQAERMRQRFEAIGKTLDAAGIGQGPRTLLVLDLEAIAAGASGTWTGDLLDLLRVPNVADGSGSKWPSLSLEAVAQRDPEVLLLLVDEASRYARDPGALLQRLRADPVWRLTTAVEKGRVYPLIDDGRFSIPGPRTTDAAETLARAIYPDLFTGP